MLWRGGYSRSSDAFGHVDRFLPRVSAAGCVGLGKNLSHVWLRMGLGGWEVCLNWRRGRDKSRRMGWKVVDWVVFGLGLYGVGAVPGMSRNWSIDRLE